MSYWDTSALVKLYAKEHDSLNFERLAAQFSEIVTSRLALFELRRILFRKEIEGSLKRGASQISFQRFLLDVKTGMVQLAGLGLEIELPFDAVLTRCFTHEPPIFIHTADAIHLATALAAKAREMVCTDARLRAASTLIGLSVFPVDRR